MNKGLCSFEPAMSLTSKPVGPICLALGVLMCLPALGLGLVMVCFENLGGISVSIADGRTTSVNAYLAWAVLGALALLGIGSIVFGIYVLPSSKEVLKVQNQSGRQNSKTP
jgi:hypothetical protein